MMISISIFLIYIYRKMHAFVLNCFVSTVRPAIVFHIDQQPKDPLVEMDRYVTIHFNYMLHLTDLLFSSILIIHIDMP